MNPDLTTVTGWSYGLAAAAYLIFTLQLALGWRGGPRGTLLLAAVGLSGVWALLGLGYGLARAPLLMGACGLADVLRMGAWFAFLLLVSRPAGAGLRLGHPLALIALLLVAVGLAAQGAAMGFPGVPSGRLVLLDALAVAVFGLVLVEQLFRNVHPDAQWNVKPLCLGLAAMFMFDIYLYADALLFNAVDANAFSVRGLAHALVIPLAGVSAARSRDWRFRIGLSRHVAFRSAALMASGLYLMFVAAAGYYVRFFGGEWGGAFSIALLFAGFLVLGWLGLSGSIRATLRVLVSKHFFSYRYDYREEWLRFTQTLSAAEGQSAVSQQVIRGLADMVESPGGALWLREVGGGSFAQAGRWNMPPSSALEPRDGMLGRYLAQTGWVVNLEEFRSSPRRYGDLELPQWLTALPNVWLIVPLGSGGELVGFVVLATARIQVDVNWEVNDLLKTAGRQAASYLVQMQATEALLEARKFDAFNRMSAFVVHDLKNIVAQLSLMVKNAERHRGNPDFQRDMLMTVEHSVERMKQLMLQLREGASPVDAPRGVDLAAVIRRVHAGKAGSEPVPELELQDGVWVAGHEARIERVIGHLVQNALDATGRDGRVWIKLERQGGQAMVEVGDTGHGMTAEFVRERLFKPFQTTKQAGMGIGAYESHQYVQELGGRVLVDSSPGAGTRVRLLLPLFGPGSSADEAQRREVA